MEEMGDSSRLRELLRSSGLIQLEAEKEATGPGEEGDGDSRGPVKSHVDELLAADEVAVAGDDQEDDHEAVLQGITEFAVRRAVFEAVRHMLVKVVLEATGHGDNWEPPPEEAFKVPESRHARSAGDEQEQASMASAETEAAAGSWLPRGQEAHWWRRFRGWERRAAAAFDLEVFGEQPGVEDYDRVYAHHTECRRGVLRRKDMRSAPGEMASDLPEEQEDDDQICGDGGSESSGAEAGGGIEVGVVSLEGGELGAMLAGHGHGQGEGKGGA